MNGAAYPAPQRNWPAHQARASKRPCGARLVAPADAVHPRAPSSLTAPGAAGCPSTECIRTAPLARATVRITDGLRPHSWGIDSGSHASLWSTEQDEWRPLGQARRRADAQLTKGTASASRG